MENGRKRNEGVSFSVLTFLGKLTGSVSTSIGTALLPLIGLTFVSVAGGEMETVKGAHTDLWIWALYILVPHMLSLLSVIPYLFYDLRGEKLAQIRSDLKERRAEVSRNVSRGLLKMSNCPKCNKKNRCILFQAELSALQMQI